VGERVGPDLRYDVGWWKMGKQRESKMGFCTDLAAVVLKPLLAVVASLFFLIAFLTDLLGSQHGVGCRHRHRYFVLFASSKAGFGAIPYRQA